MSYKKNRKTKVHTYLKYTKKALSSFQELKFFCLVFDEDRKRDI